MIAASVAALSLAAPALAHAETDMNVYATIGGAILHSDPLNLAVVQGRVGARFATYFGVEAEGALGGTADSITSGGTTVRFRARSEIAGYAVGFIPVTPKTDVLVRIGYGTSTLHAKVAGLGSANLDLDSANYGVGVQHMFDDNNGVRADFTRFDFQDSGPDNADVWSVAYVRKF